MQLPERRSYEFGLFNLNPFEFIGFDVIVKTDWNIPCFAQRLILPRLHQKHGRALEG
jgi:hypothetical protein